MTIARLPLVAGLLLLGAAAVSPAQEPQDASAPDADARALQWFQAARFGMFVHWGPVSQKGTEIGWSRGAQVPQDEYDALYQTFDPVQFDAADWVGTAVAAGMKYLVITTKHHDGFCLWPSEQTEYDIAATPFGRDVLAELAAECSKQGIRFCTYYSICDWYHPDYPTGSPGGKGSKPEADMDRYVDYLKNQLKEIVTSYGPLGVMWFDGQWEKPWTLAHGEDLYRYVKSLQPDLLVNNRVGKRRKDTSGTSKQDAGNPGDFDTPEQRIGTFQRNRPWESCITICKQWAWKPDDTMKSLAECIHTLVRTSGGDGNLLLNVGPMADGRIEPRQVARLREIGEWLQHNGTAIYGTRGGPFTPGAWGASTHRGNTIYLHVLDWDELTALPLTDAKVLSARLLKGTDVKVATTERGVELTLDATARDPIDTVVELILDGPARAIDPLPLPSLSVAAHRPARASNVFEKRDEFAADRAFDGDSGTRWATDRGTKEAWIEVDLGTPQQIGRVRIDEAEEFGKRIGKFTLQYRDGEAWRTALEGEGVGRRFEASFEPITAQVVRLVIQAASDGPTIREIGLLQPE